MHMTVREFFGVGLADLEDLDIEGQVAARKRMVEIDIDHFRADLDDGDSLPTATHKGLAANAQLAGAAQLLLRHPLNHAFDVRSVGKLWRYGDLEAIASSTVF